MADFEQDFHGVSEEASAPSADFEGDFNAAHETPAAAPMAKAPGLPWYERVLQGVKDPFNASAQLLMYSPHPELMSPAFNSVAESVNSSIKEGEKKYQTARGPNAGLDVARLAGNVANPINWIMPGGEAVGLLRAMGENALRGGLSAVLSSPVTEGDFAKEKAKQAGVGAAGGAVLTPIARGISRVISPQTSPAVKTLMEAGVTPTPGQVLGGWAQRLEDAATSIPLVGDVIKSAQGRAIAQFNTAAYQRALDPIGEKAPNIVGREGVEAVANKLGDKYDDVLSKITFRPDRQFAADYAGLKNLASALPATQAKQFENIATTQLGKATQHGTMDGETLKGVLSELRRQVKGYSADPSFDNRQLGAALDELHGALTRTLQRTNPDEAATLKALDTGWANYARIRQAAASQGAHDGVFTPAQLSSAVKALDRSVGKGNFAKGNALMQDLSEAGKSVLSQKVPDSGTPFRTLADVALGGGGAYLAGTHPLALVGGVAGATLGSLPYTPIGQRAAASVLTQRPEAAVPLAALVRRGLPLVAGPGANLATRP